MRLSGRTIKNHGEITGLALSCRRGTRKRSVNRDTFTKDDGIDNFSKISEGTKIMLGNTVVLEVVQIGKEIVHTTIHKYTGTPVLPVVGVFCRVRTGGEVTVWR